jgi:hypothetical protein
VRFLQIQTASSHISNCCRSASGAVIAAAAATKGAGTAIATEAEAGRGKKRERGKRRRSATENETERKIATGTGAETASARASRVDRHLPMSQPRPLLRQPLQPLPLLKMKSSPKGERNCERGRLSSRFVPCATSAMFMCRRYLSHLIAIGMTVVAGGRGSCCSCTAFCSQRNAAAVVTCSTRQTHPRQQLRHVARRPRAACGRRRRRA